jgi:hypothetical protein
VRAKRCDIECGLGSNARGQETGHSVSAHGIHTLEPGEFIAKVQGSRVRFESADLTARFRFQAMDAEGGSIVCMYYVTRRPNERRRRALSPIQRCQPDRDWVLARPVTGVCVARAPGQKAKTPTSVLVGHPHTWRSFSLVPEEPAWCGSSRKSVPKMNRVGRS